MSKDSRKGIHIEKDWYLDMDNYQFILNKYSGKFDAKGNETYTSLGFFSSIEGVAEKVYRLKIKETTAKNIQELVDDHKRIIKEIRETFKLKGLVDNE